MRGTVCGYREKYGVRRITPARAGNRPYRALEIHLHRDHPRACGEQIYHLLKALLVAGSPPRVRGTAPRFRRCRWWPKDHPRACGEQTLLFHLAVRVKGSPPRVRGTAMESRIAEKQGGITPARAGNSALSLISAHLPQDHPRACGEQITPSPKIPCLTGSPPRVRGTD